MSRRMGTPRKRLSAEAAHSPAEVLAKVYAA